MAAFSVRFHFPVVGNLEELNNPERTQTNAYNSALFPAPRMTA